MKIRLIASWDTSLTVQQIPTWLTEEGITFLHDASQHSDADALIILNHSVQPTTLSVNPNSTWCILQEPYLRHNVDIRALKRAGIKFLGSHQKPTFSTTPKHIITHPCLPWWSTLSYQQAKDLEIPKKTKKISCISSKKRKLQGHKHRLKLIYELSRLGLSFDLFGKGFKFIESKDHALRQYKYSIAIENSVLPNYWTEKITDCFLNYTVPIYYGCPNINDYFPEKSIININNIPRSEIKKYVTEQMDDITWETRLEFIEEARKRVLDKYSMYPALFNLVQKHHDFDYKKQITLEKFKKKRLYL